MCKATAMERIQNIWIDVEWRTHGRIPRKVVWKWLNDIQKELEEEQWAKEKDVSPGTHPRKNKRNTYAVT